MQHDDIAATIGVSGNSGELRADRPRNLLLCVGTSEDEAVIEDYRSSAKAAPHLLACSR